ncbi:hypothetical protein BN1058_02736 [Paraliobacillus sp. PM-2]|uniref:hypothetical protein n=1 Tax=Paraliobacillus sp. PM-2 TaxID=1462524 RepID=UPI00061BDBD2|nr:hypothetical protein [Paraliobacillus sp. PM-2]CQR48368.1 hypothetical protein BN1058_02736 [Paraliobacillus sp. PM-2]
MQGQSSNGGQELVCFNTEKVYDWVVLQTTVNQNIPGSDITGVTINPCASSITNLSARCFLTDSYGNPLPENAEIEVEETGDRQDRKFVIDGNKVKLQRVSFDKTIYVVIVFRGLDGGYKFVEKSDPIELTIPEAPYLCAPEGTRLVVRISDVDCSANVKCTSSYALESVDLSLGICQSVQTVADVTLELVADFCQPRDNILAEVCPNPVIPPQCPVVFPGTNSGCSDSND